MIRDRSPLRLHRFDSPLTERIREAASAVGLREVFNPSVQWATDGRQLFVAVRGRRADEPKAPVRQPFGAWLMRLSVDGGMKLEGVLDLTERASDQWGIDVVADPKLFTLGSELYVTFNTGHRRPANNLYIWRLTPEAGRPLECCVPGRQAVEKNWAFFGGSASKIGCVYSVDPLSVLEARVGADEEASGSVVFKGVSDNPVAARPSAGRVVSIGSPLALLPDGRFLAVLHRKVWFGRRRVYLPQAAAIDIDCGTVELGRYLTHSVRSLLGARTKHNPNLLSCTYVSGCALNETANRVLLSYGINDVGFGLSEVHIGALGLFR